MQTEIRKYGDLTEFVKSEAKEKAYEPPFPYETQESLPGTWGALKRGDHPVDFAANVLETDAGLSVKDCLVIERNRMTYGVEPPGDYVLDVPHDNVLVTSALMKKIPAVMHDVCAGMKDLDYVIKQIRETVDRDVVVYIMGIPVIADPSMKPYTWKLVYGPTR